MESQLNYAAAIEDFHRAHQQATMNELLAHLRGNSSELLSYEEVRKMLKLSGGAERGLRDIPLNAIVGSLGRYRDFTRDFLPRTEANKDRWARVKALATGLEGLPPIEVIQIGEVYFVKDGNHRVSVARRMGASHIQAYVTEVKSRVPLTADVQPDDLIIKAELADFLERTQLDILRPEADLSVSIPGRYQILFDQIDVHRYYLGIDLQRDISYQEAAESWYDRLYLPVIETIRALGILREFPNRTETDLYVWIAEHRAQLEKAFGRDIQTEYAASDLAAKQSGRHRHFLDRIGKRIFNTIIPESLKTGPPPGDWRIMTQAARRYDCLFEAALVPVNGLAEGWNALEQAIVLARRENTGLQGLYVVPVEEDGESPPGETVQDEFSRRCQQAQVRGELLVVRGQVSEQICKYAAFNDIVITDLAHPPGEQPLERLSSGFRQLIQRCPRPVLATPHQVSPLNHALLAFDGSSKSREGLYIASYLAGKWSIRLSVVTIADQEQIAQEVISLAQEYLKDHSSSARYLAESGPVAETILKIAQLEQCDFLIMGGYGLNPLLEVMLGSTVDQVLRERKYPVLICR